MARFCSPFSVFVYLAIAYVLTFSTATHAQNSPPLIEVKSEEDVRELKAVDLEWQRLIQDRNKCKKDAKDYKQECLCDKHQQYLEFSAKTDLLMYSSSRITWLDAILIYEENGQTKKTSLRRFSQIYYDFATSCFRNNDGTYRANHEWDKPELTIKAAQDAKDLYGLYNFEKKVGIAVINCNMKGYSENDCQCAHQEKRQLILRRTLQLDKTHPEWKNHVLIYHYNGQTFKTSWEEQVRLAKESSPVCKK